MTARRSNLLVLAVTVVAVVVIAVWRLERPAAVGISTASSRPAPLPEHVTVEVLNGTTVPGAARLGTVLLRQAGLDVVYYGTADRQARTVVLVRRGDTTGLGRTLAVLRHADVVREPDASRLVDLSVVLGSDFTKTAMNAASSR